jgi:hypothetical protein
MSEYRTLFQPQVVSNTAIATIRARVQEISFQKNATRMATKFLELIHSDLCGPLPTKYLGGAYYFIIFTDDFSRKT